MSKIEQVLHSGNSHATINRDPNVQRGELGVLDLDLVLPLDRRDDRGLHRPDVGDRGCPGVERRDDELADVTDRDRDDDDVGVRRDVGDCRDRVADRAPAAGRIGTVRVHVEAGDGDAVSGEREPDRRPDQTGSDDPDASHSGRSSRRARALPR